MTKETARDYKIYAAAEFCKYQPFQISGLTASSYLLALAILNRNGRQDHFYLVACVCTITTSVGLLWCSGMHAR